MIKILHLSRDMSNIIYNLFLYKKDYKLDILFNIAERYYKKV